MVRISVGAVADTDAEGLHGAPWGTLGRMSDESREAPPAAQETTKLNRGCLQSSNPSLKVPGSGEYLRSIRKLSAFPVRESLKETSVGSQLRASRP
jgi:hypothetical protein